MKLSVLWIWFKTGHFDYNLKILGLNRKLCKVLCLIFLSSCGVFADYTRKNGAKSISPSFAAMLLPPDYLKDVRPDNGKDPVTVNVSLHIIDVNSVRSENMDFRVDMTLRLTWRDPRIRVNRMFLGNESDSVLLPAGASENFWNPDPYITNAKISEISEFNEKSSSLTLYSNGRVQYIMRLHAILACQMQFRDFPFDVQHCPMNIESFLYDSTRVHLQWENEAETVTVNPELRLMQYVLRQPLDKTGFFKTRPTGGNFSRLVTYFRFERQLGHHVMQTFLPSLLVVSLSWFSFWVDLDVISGRITLLITSMLTLVMMSTVRSEAPKVAYIKSVDLWIAGCLFFQFLAITEFAFIKFLDNWNKTEASSQYPPHIAITKATRLGPEKLSPSKLELPVNKVTTQISPQRKQAITFRHKMSVFLRGDRIAPLEQSPRHGNPFPFRFPWQDERILPRDVDRVARIMYPLCFAVFNIFYWPLTLTNTLP